MAFVTRKPLLILTTLSLVALLAIGSFIWSGSYSVGADTPPTGPVYAEPGTMRDRSIQARPSKLQVPGDLQDPARVTQGSGNYNAMCMGCHLAPGMAGTEMSRGLDPAPPDLTRYSPHAAQAFWVIKHGIKASGMPAWGESMDDEYIWNIAAFLQELPKLDAGQYQSMVDSSGGHDHGGSETEPQDHAQGTPADHPQGPAPGSAAEPHAHPPRTPPHDDTSADSGTHAGMDHARQRISDAKSNASHDHSPGTRADRHAPAAAKPPSIPATEPVPEREELSPPPESHDDGHDHEH